MFLFTMGILCFLPTSTYFCLLKAAIVFCWHQHIYVYHRRPLFDFSWHQHFVTFCRRQHIYVYYRRPLFDFSRYQHILVYCKRQHSIHYNSAVQWCVTSLLRMNDIPSAACPLFWPHVQRCVTSAPEPQRCPAATRSRVQRCVTAGYE